MLSTLRMTLTLMGLKPSPSQREHAITESNWQATSGHVTANDNDLKVSIQSLSPLPAKGGVCQAG
jgi:hypothetical protein